MNTKVSNCITEIPQDIKLELNNGTLTLKAGSKVYIPNGFESDGTTKKFDAVVIESDKVCSGSNDTGTYVVIIDYLNGGLYANFNINLHTYSGSSAPTNFIGLFYNTTTNTVGARFDTSSQFTGRYSLPIAIVTNSSTTVCSSIDQVFNGFGYIGSTVFALPGVKGLIPNGRNADGSLKNIKFTNNDVQIFTNVANNSPNRFVLGNTSEFDSFLNISEFIGCFDYAPVPSGTYGSYFNTKENQMYFYYNSKWNKINRVLCGSLSFTDLRISYFNPKTVFHALDYNDKSTISGWSMPSSRYIDLTLGASDSTYTAPANGWFCLAINTGLTYLDIFYNNNGLGSTATNPNNRFIRRFIPAFKGDVIIIYYQGTPNTSLFRFYYAEGEN